MAEQETAVQLTEAEREAHEFLWSVLQSGGLGGTSTEDERLQTLLLALDRLTARAVEVAAVEARVRREAAELVQQVKEFQPASSEQALSYAEGMGFVAMKLERILSPADGPG